MTLRIMFWRSEKPRERILSDAFLAGVRKHGDVGIERALSYEIPDPLPDCDIACMVGVKSRRLILAHWSAGIHSLYLDKGYVRTEVDSEMKNWKYWRVALDSHHPTRYLQRMRFDASRWNRLGIELAPWRGAGEKIIFAGSSEKYHEFYGIVDPTQYAQKMVKRIAGQTNLPIIYRPKPSWDEAVPIEGTKFSRGGPIASLLQGAHTLVTHGSNAVFEAVIAGVPCVVLGDAVAKHISSTDIMEVASPRLANEAERLQMMHALAFCQWTIGEMRSGEAWEHIKQEFMTQCV